MYDKEENVNSLHYVCCFLENKISIPSRWDTPTEIHLNFPESNKYPGSNTTKVRTILTKIQIFMGWYPCYSTKTF